MRIAHTLAIAMLVAPLGVPAPVAAQPSSSPADACSLAIRYEVQDRFPQARGVRTRSADVSPMGRNQARVSGRGEFEDRNGGESRFEYGCTYSFRNGRTSDLDISDVHHKDGGSNGAAVAGLVLGAIVIGAIAANASKDKDRDRDDAWHHDEVWSPSSDVRCVRRERACYKNGRFSQSWTDRMFYR
ncbi:MAG: hypothetical protein U1C74_09585 [Phenylobacterium sp.]|nr:hypothetical protein [Phenylobacterium sp.]